MPKILIYYEHKAREYQYCHALKYELERRGYSVGLCHIANRHTWWYKIFSKPKVVIVGGLSLQCLVPGMSVIEDYADFLRGRTEKIINLQAEQISRDEDSNYNIILDSEWKDIVYYICWGGKRKKQILNREISDSQLAVTGAMHLDFFRSEFCGFYKTKQEMAQIYKIPSSEKWILLMSSFVFATMPTDHMKAIYALVKKSDPKYQYEQIQKKRDISLYSLEKILDWIDRYLSEYSEGIFIYRPHPKETKTADMIRMIESHPGRFFYIQDESIQQWISVCDIVDNWISTAIVEAFFARRQANVIQPIKVQKDFEPAILDGCKKISTYKEFEKVQHEEQRFCEETFPINKEKMIGYYKMSGSCAYIQVADFVEKVYHSPAHFTGKSKFTIRTILKKWFLFRVYRSIYAVTRIKFSRISPVFRKTMSQREREVDIGLVSGDILITKEDRKICRKIKKYVKKIAGRDLSEMNKILIQQEKEELKCQ